MSDERAVTWACEADRQRDMRRRRIADRKHAVTMWWHGAYWRALHLTRLARSYSVFMCWANLYRRFPDGRCMWCGFVHTQHDEKAAK